jgi:hypothetical protein
MGFNVIENNKIIQKHFHEATKVFFKSFFDYQLVCWWNIFQIECHDDLNKKIPINNESNFVPIFQGKS